MSDKVGNCLIRLERETLKYMQVDNIFQKLRQSDSVDQIYKLFNSIFEQEHQFTIKVFQLTKNQELISRSQTKKQGFEEFNLPEQYKLNSHIFKQNLTLIINLIIDDIWVAFNKMVSTNHFDRYDLSSNSISSAQVQKDFLFEIEEESQVENCRTEHNIEDQDLSHIIGETMIEFPDEQLIEKENSLSNTSDYQIAQFQHYYLVGLKQLSPRNSNENNQIPNQNGDFKSQSSNYTPRKYQNSLKLPSQHHSSSVQYLQQKNKSNDQSSYRDSSKIHQSSSKSLSTNNIKKVHMNQYEIRQKTKLDSSKSPRLTYQNINPKGISINTMKFLVQKMTGSLGFKK